MMLMIVLQTLYLQLRSKALNMTLAHHYTYQISQDSNSPMDWIHWLSTIPIVGSPLFQAHAHSVHALLFHSQSTNSSRNGYGSTVPHMWKALKMIQSLLCLLSWERLFLSFDNPPVVNKLWRILKVPMNLAVKCFWKDGVQSLSLDQPKPFMSW